MSHERKTHLDLQAVLLLVLCTALWGITQVAAKVALSEIPPLSQGAARSAGAALLLMLWARGRGIALFERDGTFGAGWLAGALFALEFGCIFVGLQYTSASRMVVFIYLSPFVVALGMPFIAHSERLRPLQWLGLLAGFSGVALAFVEGFTGPTVGSRQWVGDTLGVTAALLWGATTLVVRGSKLAGAAAEKTLFYQLAVSALLMAVGAALAGETPTLRLSAQAWWLLGFQAVVVSFASFLTWFWLVRHYAATRLSAFTLLTPLFGLLAGAAILGEPVTARLLVALATVCAGIVLVNR